MHRGIGVVIIGIALVVVALACGDDPPPSPTPVARTAEDSQATEPTAAQTSAPEPSDSLRLSAGESGVLEHDSGARIEIPQGATDEAVTVSITEVEPSDDKLPSGIALGTVFDISIGQVEIERPVVIHIPYEHRQGMTAEDVRALHWDEDTEKWEIVDGEVDEANRRIRVEVSELSWFTSIVRDILGYDYAEDAAELKSCGADPEATEATHPFKLTAEATNHSVEHKMYVEFALEDRVRGLAGGFGSPSAFVGPGVTHEFSLEWLEASPPGELSVDCVLRVGTSGIVSDSWESFEEVLEDAKYLLDWLSPELDRETVGLRVGEYSRRPGTEARLSECSALSKDGEVVLTAMPEAVERGQLRVFTVEFKVYSDGELVYEHTSRPKEKTAQNYSAFSELQGPWETQYRPTDSGEYMLDCILHGNMTGLLIGSGPRSFKWLEWVHNPAGTAVASFLGDRIKSVNERFQWYSSTDFTWPASAAAPTPTPTSQDSRLETSDRDGTSATFASVSAGDLHTCGVKPDGSVQCWGYDDFGEATPPAGEFASVSVGIGHTCGLKRNGTVQCWGADYSGESGPPSGEFTSVSAGYSHMCGVKTDSSVQCWRSGNFRGQATPPGGEFASVSAGGIHTCGVKTEGSVQCWGDDEAGQSTPPGGEFASVSAGHSHTCGVRTDGFVQCWGWDEYGQSTPPGGEFASVSAGSYHTCGVKTDGSVQCWGNDDAGQSTPPTGEFVSVSAGGGHTCGVKTDGSVQCWGDDEWGQSTPPGAEVRLRHSEEKVIRVGAAVSETGRYAEEGKHVREGYLLWEEWVNERGGINIGGELHKIELILYDDGSDPDTTAKLVERLIDEDEVHFLLGPYSSTLTQSAIEAAESRGVILVEGAGASETLFEQSFENLFAVLTPSGSYIESALRLLADHGARSVVIAYADTAFARSVAEGARRWAGRYGMEVLAVEAYPRDAPDVSGIVSGFKTLEPDVFVGIGYFNDTVLFVRVAKELDFNPKATVMTVGPTDQALIEEVGADANYLIGPTQWEPLMSYRGNYFGSASDYAERFRKKWGRPPVFQSAGATAAALALHLAIEAAGSVDADAVRTALRNLNVSTFYGPIKFDSTGKNTAKPMGVIQIQSSETPVVAPANAATASVIYPVPSRSP